MIVTTLIKFSIVSLSDKDYLAVMERLSLLGLTGGVFFDALHAYAALQAGVDHILTLNPRDFKRTHEILSA